MCAGAWKKSSGPGKTTWRTSLAQLGLGSRVQHMTLVISFHSLAGVILFNLHSARWGVHGCSMLRPGK